MTKSDSENLTQDMKEKLKEKSEESSRMQKDSEDKKEDSEKKKEEEEKEPQLRVSESSQSTTFQSPRDSSMSNDNIHSSASDRSLPVVLATQKMVTVEDPGKVEEGRGGSSDAPGYLKSKKEAKLNMALLGLRITAFVFCLISFSVLAADIAREPTISYTFKEYTYSLSVNVIAFVYSGLQICDLVKYLITKKHTVDPRLRRYFNFILDQKLTYLLLSSSSSAATLTSIIETDSGPDEFTEMANASTALSYLAFVAFALASLVSGYTLCRLN